jgi:hypothetical protein
MALIRNRNPIEVAFRRWITSYPESYHPLDMERFYTLVKSVMAYSRSDATSSSEWLKEKIEKFPGHHLTEEDILDYCDKFMMLKDFYYARKIPLIEIS